MLTEPMVIVGAGQAGIQIAESLRQEGHTGSITLLGEEPYGPYHRPPLSKKWLLERPDVSSLAIRGAEAIARRDIKLLTSTRAVAIDRRTRHVHLDNGQQLPFAGLALCTGAKLRALPLPGAELMGVFGLKTIDDAQRIANALDACAAAGDPVVIIGGGFIGLEVAASACKRGLKVTVLEGLTRLMSRVIAPIVSEAAARVHQAHGVALHYDVKIAELTGKLIGQQVGNTGAVRAVRLEDGREFAAGCVVVGIGVIQNDQLAMAAGLGCDRGIVVDSCSRTSDPSIVAAGDCAARRASDGSLRRLESVQNAVEQGKSAAAALLGRERPFTVAPWFWSDQHELKLQMVGLSQGYDQIITRGDLHKPAFSAYYYCAGQLIAVDSLSRPQDHMVARKLLDSRVSPLPEQVADETFALQSLLPVATKAAG
jgi:3-phenylpropionate/trans-cinnamate dioxygenase ferredoxin reductase component